ncbi:MAG: hypothetical protein K2X87_26800 [Gemmataceae bacterium]|nr:hypothetical protein [Gemmataceae bacterium]
MPDTPARPPAAPAARPPALPSTADAVPYVPVSWLAVGAMGLAVLFVVVLLVAGYGARSDKRPLTMDWVLILPVAAVVLSFAARRVIRDSEGTRTGRLFGLDLPAAAWWTAVVGGLGYAAYLVAVDYSVGQDAKGEVVRWADATLKGDLARAFHRTRDPNERASIAPDNRDALEARYRTEFTFFRQCDVVRLATRNPGACEFVPGGVRDWKVLPNGGIECVYRGAVRCPDGVFPVNVSLRGVEAAAGDAPVGRQWQISLTPSGFVQQPEVRLTPYGWYVAALEKQGGAYARQFLPANRIRAARPYTYLQFARPDDAAAVPEFRPFAGAGQLSRTLATGVPVGRAGTLALPVSLMWTPGEGVYNTIAGRLFTLPADKDHPTGKPPTPDQAKTFAAVWNVTGVEPAGGRLKNSPDTQDLTTIVLDQKKQEGGVWEPVAVELRVPVELPLPVEPGREPAAARGRLVLVCDDPPVLAELKRLRAAADPVNGTSAAPPTDSMPPSAWRLVRIESDLRPVSIRSASEPGAPGNMAAEPFDIP